MSRPVVVPVLLTALLVAGCGGEEPAVVSRAAADRPGPTAGPSGPTAGPPESRPAVSTPSEPVGDEVVQEAADDPAPAPTPVVGGGAGEGGGSAGSGGTGGVVPPGTDPGTVVWPDEVVPTHGSEVWAVHLAVGSPIDPWQSHKLAETADYAGFLGYEGSGIGSVSCDRGAAEQLGFHPDDNRVAVYFDSAARAQEFVLVYDRQDVGSAPVTTYCLD